jgi:hypothetical protein
MLRRDFGIGILSTVFARHAIAAFEPHGGRPLHAFKRGRACVYLLGFGEARDESWATPRVRRASTRKCCPAIRGVVPPT